MTQRWRKVTRTGSKVLFLKMQVDRTRQNLHGGMVDGGKRIRKVCLFPDDPHVQNKWR